MNPDLLLRSAHALSVVCLILFLPLSSTSLWVSWSRSRKAFPRIVLLLPCMAVMLALALGLYVMGQFGRLMLSFPELIPSLMENGSWLLQIQVENALYPTAFMAIWSLAYLFVFALCLIPGRGRGHDSVNEQDNREGQR